MAFNLKKVLKALLFSSSQPLATKDIQAAFTRFHDAASSLALGQTPGSAEIPADAPVSPAEDAVEIAAEQPGDAELYQEVPSLITATQIREAMDEIAAEMRERNEGLLLIEGSAGYRLVTHPQYARWVRVLRNEPPPLKLSPSSVETLAIVAYRQPVTRAEIETIRGVSAEAGINKLLERELIYIVGRADLPGRPIQYGTTDLFLEFTGIKSLDELPASDVLSNRQIDDWLQSALNPTKPPTDEEMGLPLETSEGDSPNFEPVTVEHTHVAAEASPEVKTS
jgi:segregation and condensation protein B